MSQSPSDVTLCTCIDGCAVMHSVGQNHVHTVYTNVIILLRFHLIYGHVRRKYTVLAKPSNA